MVGPLMYVTSLVTSLTYLPTSLPLDSALLAERKWKMENGKWTKIQANIGSQKLEL